MTSATIATVMACQKMHAALCLGRMPMARQHGEVMPAAAHGGDERMSQRGDAEHGEERRQRARQVADVLRSDTSCGIDPSASTSMPSNRWLSS